MSKYIVWGLLAYLAGRKHRMIRKKLCRCRLRQEARRMLRRV